MLFCGLPTWLGYSNKLPSTILSRLATIRFSAKMNVNHCITQQSLSRSKCMLPDDIKKRRLEKWLRLLTEGDREMNKIAAEKLGVIGDSAAVPALTTALDRRPAEVSAAAARSPGTIGDQSAVPALIKALQEHHDTLVNMAAADALGELRATKAVDALEKVIIDYDIASTGDRHARIYSDRRGLYISAIQALEKIGTSRSLAIARKAQRY